MNRVLICGSNGLLGSWWRQHRWAGKEVLCLRESREKNHLSNSVFASKSNLSQLTRVIEKNEIDCVINCVALANVDQCEKDKDLADFLNAQFPRILATASNSTGAKVVHISTDHLYGNQLHSTLIKESLPTSACNHYAKTKLAGEAFIQEITDNHLILRTNFFGRSVSHKPSYSDWLRDSLRQGREINIPLGVYFNPVHYTKLIELTHSLIDKKHTGIFNISSDSCVEKFEFAVRMAGIYGLNKNLIRACQKPETTGLSPKRPSWMCLDNSKVSSTLGVKIGDYIEQLSLLI